MNLPIIEKTTFKINVDSVELELTEPSLSQIGMLAKTSSIDGENSDESLKAIVDVLVSLMDSYKDTMSSKKTFVKGLSIRQITMIVESLMKELEPKKALVETGTQPSS